MIIFGMDTSSVNATVAILNDKKMIGEFIVSNDKTHSQIIMPLMDDLLKKCNMNISDVDVFAVCSGPGSFTGLRIGMSTVKTLAQMCNKPVIGVSSLDALYENCSLFSGIVCPIIDARHNQVYNAVYKNGDKIISERIIQIEQLLDELKNESVVFCGDGVLAYSELISKYSNFVIANQNISMQKASSVCMSAYKRAVNNDFDNLYSLVPVYLRKSQAERELDEKNNKENEK